MVRLVETDDLVRLVRDLRAANEPPGAMPSVRAVQASARTRFDGLGLSTDRARRIIYTVEAEDGPDEQRAEHLATADAIREADRIRKAAARANSTTVKPTPKLAEDQLRQLLHEAMQAARGDPSADQAMIANRLVLRWSAMAAAQATPPAPNATPVETPAAAAPQATLPAPDAPDEASEWTPRDDPRQVDIEELIAAVPDAPDGSTIANDTPPDAPGTTEAAPAPDEPDGFGWLDATLPEPDALAPSGS